MQSTTSLGLATLRAGLISIAATLLLAGTGHAHSGDGHWLISGNSLKMSYTPAGQGTKFSFKTRQQIFITPTSIAEDPRVERSTLIVRGSGATPGSSGLIVLDPARWTPIGPPDAPRGWKFLGSPYYTDGVSKILIKAGKTTGSLQIKAESYWWPFQINGAQDSIQIVLKIGGSSFCAEFSPATMSDLQNFTKTDGNGDTVSRSITATYALAPTECPAVCGNGTIEDGEQCDDANTVDNDTCSNTCEGCDLSEVDFASTYDGIQQLIFDNPAYACSNDICHGAAALGGLDLRAGSSHSNLVGVDSVIQPSVKRVFAGDQDLSMLYRKIASKTLGAPAVPGSPMPSNGSTVSEELLEALRLWIRGGAPETGVVAGTAELLGSCLPPATPLDIPQPPVPDPAAGTQFAMPGYTLASNTEVEGCVASYYDVSATVPESAMVPCPDAFPGTNETGPNAGKCFSYRQTSLYQDAQSHHSIVHIYPGTASWNDDGWGTWSCYGGNTPGASCSPDVSNACGTGGVCGSQFHRGVACLETLTEDWGAPDFNASTSPQFSGSQESTAIQDYPTGVYGLLPLKGLIVWNSHAFNLTTQGTSMEAWINMTYTDQRTWPAQGLFNDNWIFVQNVPPFEQRQYCATHTFANNTRLFQLSSHTHKRGIRWRYYDAPQTPCAGPATCAPPPGSPTSEFYESYDYSDALTKDFDPPKLYSGTEENRTIKFCALFDNGFLNASTVKTRSGSPTPTGNLIFGGPCGISETYCMGGVNKGLACNGLDTNCPGSTCDACYLKGGVTTEDEMFIALGTFYVAP